MQRQLTWRKRAPEQVFDGLMIARRKQGRWNRRPGEQSRTHGFKKMPSTPYSGLVGAKQQAKPNPPGFSMEIKYGVRTKRSGALRDIAFMTMPSAM